ncbi:MAG: hypothetical protein ACRDP6_29200 [Actinoallomurus sp.]
MTARMTMTLCGSTRFRDAFTRVNRELTLKGVAVFAPGVFAHDGDVITDEQKQQLDGLHLDKISMAHEILVLNVGGYIGESTRREIEFAQSLGKPVRYLERPDFESEPWANLDGPDCPVCTTPRTKWDGISPDYPGDWWECAADHRFILDHDGRAYVPEGY